MLMVLILDGNSDHVAHKQKKIGVFGEKIRILPAPDLSKGQIKYQ